MVFEGLDGHRSVATIEDALNDDVLIAENLDGRPLDSDHGAPVRLVSPSQYGYISTKHLSRIEVHTSGFAEHSQVPRGPAARGASALAGLGRGASRPLPRPVGTAGSTGF